MNPGTAWPLQLLFRLCRELDLVHCVDPCNHPPQSGNLQYFRLHGITGCGYRYTDADLGRPLAWTGQIPGCMLFNNNSVKDDALRFMAIGERC